MTDKKKAPPLVHILWEDATQVEADRWVEAKANRKYEPCLVETVGFLLVKDKRGVIVTPHWHHEHTGPTDQIPAGMIRKMTTLRR